MSKNIRYIIVTRDIKQDGSCPACKEYLEGREKSLKDLAEIQERDKQDRIRREEEKRGKK